MTHLAKLVKSELEPWAEAAYPSIGPWWRRNAVAAAAEEDSTYSWREAAWVHREAAAVVDPVAAAEAAFPDRCPRRSAAPRRRRGRRRFSGPWRWRDPLQRRAESAECPLVDLAGVRRTKHREVDDDLNTENWRGIRRCCVL